MNTVNIEKLEELNGFQWGYKNREFELRSLNKDCCKLYENNYLNMHGKIDFVGLKLISLKNLTELEFYGLKVVLNEKPKLTRKERDFLEIHDIETYIARDESGLLVIGNTEPIQENDYWEWEENKLYLGESTFNFITWESGKAWSKTELMELEVIDD